MFEDIEPLNKLTHNNSDVGKVWMRQPWVDSNSILAFSWCSDSQKYLYVLYKVSDGVEEMVWRKPGSDVIVASRSSKTIEVGIGVLNQIDLVHINKGNEMSKNVNYVGEFNVVQVVYGFKNVLDTSDDVREFEKFYNFKIDKTLQPEKGSKVLVEAANGYDIATVVKVFTNSIKHAKEINKANAWVVTLIDTSSHDKRIENTEELKYIKETLDRGLEQIEQVQKYQLLAKLNPDMAKAITRMGELTGSSVIDVTAEDSETKPF